MSELLSIAISNAIVAALLGMVALVICRWTKSLRLAHAIWILVLVKLVTPPLFDVPLPIMPEWAANSDVFSTMATAQSPSSLIDGTSNQSLAGDSFDASTAYVVEGNHVPDAVAAETTGNSEITVVTWLIWTWLAGAILVACYQIYSTALMCRLMKLATPDPRIDRAMNRISRAANIKNYPTARVVPWVTSPMLWGLRGTSVIVLPSKLLDSIDDDAADTLLLHELAHFQRGDQWVRILEIIVSTLFWWHPVVWIALHQIEIYEEQCCDAWVVAQDPANRRKYAEALLDTVDFISDEQSNAMPLVSSGLGRVRFLQKRVKAILAGETSVGMTKTNWAVLVPVLALIPLQPILLQASSSIDEVAKAKNEEPVAELELADASIAEEAEQEPIVHVPGPEYARARSAYGTFELTASRGYEVKLKHVVGGNFKDLSSRYISCAAFEPPSLKSPVFVAGSRDGSVWRFDCQSGSPIELVGEFESPIHSVDVARDGSLIAVGTADGTVRIIDAAETTNVRQIDNDAPVRCVRFSMDAKTVVVTTDTTWKTPAVGKVEIWETDTLTRKQTILCPTAVGAATIDVNGDVLTAEWNGMLRTWSSTGVPISAVQKAKDAVSAAAFSPNAVNLATLEMTAKSNQ